MHASAAPNANRLSLTIAGAVRLVASHNRSAFGSYYYAGFWSSGSALHGKAT